MSNQTGPIQPGRVDDAVPGNCTIEPELAARLGPVHARQRLGLEADREARAFSPFRLKNWYSAPWLIRYALRLTGLHGRAKRNALAIRTVTHTVELAHLPTAFDGFRILHLSDLHIDGNDALADQIIGQVRQLDYDLCVLTGDYRFTLITAILFFPSSTFLK